MGHGFTFIAYSLETPSVSAVLDHVHLQSCKWIHFRSPKSPLQSLQFQREVYMEDPHLLCQKEKQENKISIIVVYE